MRDEIPTFFSNKKFLKKSKVVPIGDKSLKNNGGSRMQEQQEISTERRDHLSPLIYL